MKQFTTLLTLLILTSSGLLTRLFNRASGRIALNAMPAIRQKGLLI